LFATLHTELRRLAGRIGAGHVGHTLQPTALVNEAYLKLFGGRPRSWNDEVHFMRSAAMTMRRILLDHVKRPHRNQVQYSAMEQALDGMLVDLEASCGGDLKAIDEALEQLAAEDEQIAAYVTLRFFGGRTNLETTRILGIGERTGESHWAFARSWLAARLRP
jgi:RNA polymerase sigma factor (TIGR02999 family)